MHAGQEPTATAGPARPWHGDTPVGADLARAIIRTQFPNIRARKVEGIGSGWDNDAFLVDDTIVFRFPRKASAVALLETEARVLPQLAPLLPLPVPVPEWVGQPSELFPRFFLGYRVLLGRTACAAALTDSEREWTARSLAAFLSSLHAIPADGLGLPPDLLRRGDFASRLPLIDERLHTLQRRGVIAGPAPWLGLFREVEGPSADRRACVTHGDFYACNLLVDDEREISGVIDWGDVHVGDPAIDLLVVFAFLPHRARAAFFDVYGAIDDAVAHTARLRAAFHAISVAWTGVETGNDDLATEGRVGMFYALDTGGSR